jgi:hypothetical protein
MRVDESLLSSYASESCNCRQFSSSFDQGFTTQENQSTRKIVARFGNCQIGSTLLVFTEMITAY